jgi:protein involved in polysaccharide export with SLBB domain
MAGLMTGLTGCGTSRSAYGRQGNAGLKPTGQIDTVQIVEKWGARDRNPNPSDPEIVPGVLLGLTCLTDGKLNGDFRVDFNGSLSLPYDVTLNASGLTLSALKTKLNSEYRPYFKSPTGIDARVKERHRYVDVRGLVEKPGRYIVEPNASLDEIIGLAGGFIKETPPQSVRIHKDRKVFILGLNQYYSQAEGHSPILGWLGGEELFFQKEIAVLTGEQAASSQLKQPVYILGEVRKPGDYMVNPGSDFVDTMVQAGGFTERADLSNIELIRKTPDGRHSIDFAWNDLLHSPAPHQGDVVIVHADTTSRGERRTTLFATLISAAASIVTSAILVLSYNRGRI